MKFIVTYLAGLITGLLLIANYITGNFIPAIILCSLITGLALFFCSKYHKKKSRDFWNKVKGK